jgi:hypothetical protein
MSTLSVVVFALPEMKELSQCLESVQWADTVTVRRLGDDGELLSTEEIKPGSSGGATDWCLRLWGEERVEAELRNELQAFRSRNGLGAALSYRIAVRSRLLDDWAAGSLWGPSPAPRLSREPCVLPPGWWDAATEKKDVGHRPLRGWIGDYSLAEIDSGVGWVNRCSTLYAAQMQARHQKFTVAKTVGGSLGTFVRLLWMNGVFAGGIAGVTLSVMAAYTRLLTGAKLWEAARGERISK